MGQGIGTLFEKPSRARGGGLVSQRTILGVQTSFILKRMGVVIVANFLVNPFALYLSNRSAYNVPINAIRQTLSSVLKLSGWKSVIPLRSEP